MPFIKQKPLFMKAFKEGLLPRLLDLNPGSPSLIYGSRAQLTGTLSPVLVLPVGVDCDYLRLTIVEIFLNRDPKSGPGTASGCRLWLPSPHHSRDISESCTIASPYAGKKAVCQRLVHAG